MFLAWPENSVGMGAPVAINRTEAWWIGPSSAVEGGTVSVFGRNLTYPGTYAIGATSPLVYLESATGSSQTYLPAVSAANPYKVDFSVNNVNPGTYNVWIHNGAGGHFGWSGPLPLSVSANSPWNCQTSGSSTFSVMSFGAAGNGISDDTLAIAYAISAAGTYASNPNHSYATVFFPVGTYMVTTGFRPPSNVCFAGAGTTNWQTQSGNNGSASILRLSTTTATCGASPSPVQAGGAFIWANEESSGSNNVEFTNLVIDANGNIPCVNQVQGTHIRFRSSANVKFDHIVLNGTGPTIYSSGFTSIDISNGVNYYITNSTIIGSGIENINTHQVFMNGNLFLAADNSGGMMGNVSAFQTAFWNNTQEDLQYFNTANPATQIPYSLGSTSYIAAIAGQSLIGTGLGPYGTGRIGGSATYETGLIYIGDNNNINAGPCDPTNTSGIYPTSYPGCASSTNTNSGEQILFETPDVDYGGMATDSTTTTVTVSGLTESSCGFSPSSNCIGEDAIIVGGTGVGQNRHIVAQNGTTVTVSTPWLVNPDSTSTIYVGNVTYQVAVYHNIEQGKADQSSRYTALTGVETWSNVYALVYDRNQVSNVRTGIYDASLVTSNRTGENWIVPNYFNLFTNNSITSSTTGVVIADAFFGGVGDPQAVASIGNVFRNNVFGTANSNISLNTGLYVAGIEFTPTAALPGAGNTIQGIIFDGNSFVVDTHGAAATAATGKKGVPSGLWTDSGDALIIDTLLSNNSFLLTAGPSSKPTGTSYGMVFGSDQKNHPAIATPGNSCVEVGANAITAFAKATYGLTCTQE